jgi:hypothetical protein
LRIVVLALTLADLSVAGWLLLPAGRTVRPRPARVTGLALLLSAGFLIYADHGHEPASQVVPPPVVPVGNEAHV